MLVNTVQVMLFPPKKVFLTQLNNIFGFNRVIVISFIRKYVIVVSKKFFLNGHFAGS